MPALQVLSARHWRTILTLLVLLGWQAVTVPFAAAQNATDGSINTSVWQQKYGTLANSLLDNNGMKHSDEMTAGLAPGSSRFQVSTFSTSGTDPNRTFSSTFSSVANKYYTVLGASLPSGTWGAVSGASPIIGDGTTKTFNVSQSANPSLHYFRVVVQDNSTAGDMVSDWAKAILGYSMGSNINTQSQYDHTALANALAAQNVVTIAATDPNTTQPNTNVAVSTDLGTFTVTRSGYFLFSQITVNLTSGGTATAGLDYVALPSSVTFPVGVKTQTIAVTPLYNPARTSSATVTLTVSGSAGFTIGTPATAIVNVLPADLSYGTGLTGSYFSNSSSTYANTNNLGGITGTYNYNSLTTSSAVTITAANPAVVTWTAHGLLVGSPVVFSTTGSLPNPLTAGTTYYVILAGLTANTFEVSATPGGTAVNTLGAGQSGTQTASTLPAATITWTDTALLPPAAFAIGNPVNLSFSSGNLSTAVALASGITGPPFDKTYAVTAANNTAKQFTVGISGSSLPAGTSLPASGTGNCFLSAVKTPSFPPRIDPTVDFHYGYGLPSSGSGTLPSSSSNGWVGRFDSYLTPGVYTDVSISNATPAVVTWGAHGLAAGAQVIFATTGTLPTGLTAGTTYFVSATGLTTNTFQVSATNGGASIATSSAGTGTQSALALVSGSYTFQIQADDGARVYLDVNNNGNFDPGETIIDVWTPGASTVTAVNSSPVTLTTGTRYHIRVEYLQLNNNASVQLQWEKPGDSKFAPIPGGNAFFDTTTSTLGWTDQYWSNTSFAGLPRFADYPGAININWGTGTPSQTLPSADNFSILWDGYVSSATGGTYDFSANAADGVTIYIDLNQNGTFDGGTETVLAVGGTPAGGSGANTTGIALAAGQRYKIRLAYAATSGNSLVNVSWKRHTDTVYSLFNASGIQSADNLTIYRDSGATTTTGWWATYFFNSTWTNPPMYSVQDTSATSLSGGTSPVTIATSFSTVAISQASPAVVTWNSNTLTANTPVTFSVSSGGALPTGLTAGTTYFVSATGLTSSTFQVSATVGGASINTSSAGSGTFTAASAAVVTWTAHGLAANTPVIFSTAGSLPTGLTAGTTYFVTAANMTANTFEVSTSSGGTTVVAPTSAGSGTQTASTGTTYTYGAGKPGSSGLTSGGSSNDNWATRDDAYIKDTVGGGSYQLASSVVAGGGDFAHLLLDTGSGLTEVIPYNTGSLSTVTISNASPAVVTWSSHGLTVGTPVVFTTTGALPTGLTAGTTYYVISVPTTSTFQVSASPGGAAINTSSAGSGTHTASTSTSAYTVSLTSGQIVHVVLEHYNLFGNAAPALWWKKPADTAFSVVPAANLFKDAAATLAGVTASYWTNTSYYGDASFVNYPTQISLSSTSGVPAQSFTTTNFYAEWDAYLQPTTGGAISFDLQAGAGARVFLDLNQNGNFGDAGEQLIFYSDPANTVQVDPWVAGNSTAAPVHTATYNLVGGQRYKLRVQFFDSTSASMAQLRWQGDGPANTTMAGIPNTNFFLDATTPQVGVLATYWPTPSSNTINFTAAPAYSVAENTNPGIYNNFGTGRPVGVPQSDVTISIGANALVTWLNGTHGLTAGTPVVFMTSGALPSGLTAGTVYFVSATGLTTTAFEVSTTVGGTPVTTSGTQSGTQAAATIGFDNFSVRWAGQVLPQYTETYYFDGYVDDGVRIWVNNQLIVNRWPGGGVTDSIGSINLQAGVRYDIVMEYYEGGGNADAHLYWYSNDQAKQIIPTARLFPTVTSATPVTLVAATTGGGTAGTATLVVGNTSGISIGEVVSGLGGSNPASVTVIGVNTVNGTITLSSNLVSTVNSGTNLTFATPAALPAITSASSAVALMGLGNPPFSYTITASNGGGSFTASGLPSGITLANGVLSGTPTGPAQNYPVTLTATNAAGTVSFTLNLLVLNNAGNCTREVFAGLADASISTLQSTIHTLTASGNLPTPDTVASLEDATTTYGANTGERLRGWFTAPVTGNYYFYIAASNVAELWIANSSEAVTKLRRAYVSTASTVPSRTWNTQLNQQSPWLVLNAGQQYYFEVLHNTGGSPASSHLSVAWYVDPTGTSPYPLINTTEGPGPATTGGIVPGYALSPWTNPPTTTTPGTIYLTTLTAVSGTTGVNATGGAYIRLNGTTGVVHLNYSGLTSGATFRRIYKSNLPNPPTLLFDLDAADRNYPNSPTSTPAGLVTTDGGYTWTGVDTASLSNSLVYLSIGTVNNPGGEVAGTFGKVAGSQADPSLNPDPSAGYTIPSWTENDASVADNSRFLTQATFGPSPTDMSGPNSVATLGYNAWITNQFTIPSTHMVPQIIGNISSDGTDAYGGNLTYNAWWRNSVTGPDQLRQRAAFALSEILVTSLVGPLDQNGRAVSDYYDNLLDFAFTDFRTILKQISLTPAMGAYLNMQGNVLGNIANGTHPNENYAREIMQLFSIGLYKLWPDGTLMLDSNGNPIPTYDQTVITGSARVLTGWNWGQSLLANNRLPTSGPGANYLDPMVLEANQHELGTKIQLDNVMLPAATVTVQSDTSHDPAPVSKQVTIQSTDPILGPGNLVTTTITSSYDLNGLDDFEAMLNSIVTNSSCAPYICRQLIQRLVTSNPTPGYVYRVVQVFNGTAIDGSDRGNMQNVIRAILMDHEARSATEAAAVGFGKQREPLLRLTGPARTFMPTGQSGVTYREAGGQVMLFTTPSAHRLTTGDTVFVNSAVDNGASTSNLPVSSGYTAGNVTPNYAYVPSTHIATITVPGYIAGDTVKMQFTTGTLSNSTIFGAVQTYTVATATPANLPTGSFTVNLSTVGTPPATTISAISQTNPCTVTTPTPHSLAAIGSTQSVTISGVTGGTFSSGSINSTLTATVTGANTFTVPLNCTNNTTFNFTNSAITYTSSGATLTPNNFTTNNNSIVGASYSNIGSGDPTQITITGLNVYDVSGLLVAGHQIYISFSVGNLVGGHDGVYTITSAPTSNTFIITVPGATASQSGSVLVPRFNAGYNISHLGNASTIRLETTNAFDCSVGDQVWIDFGAVTSPLPAKSGAYPVSSISTVPGVSSFSQVPPLPGFTAENLNVISVGPVTPAITDTSLQPTGTFVYPLANGAVPWTRSGTCRLDFGTYNMGITDSSITQTPLYSQTVFNFFYPGYQYPGAIAQAGMTTPEFQLSNDSNVVLLTNVVTAGVLNAGNLNGYTSFTGGGGTVVMDLSPYMTAAQTQTGAIATTTANLYTLLCGVSSPNTTQQATQTAIVSYVDNLTNFPMSSPPTNSQMRDRVRAIIQLILSSAEYSIQK